MKIQTYIIMTALFSTLDGHSLEIYCTERLATNDKEEKNYLLCILFRFHY